MWPFPKDPVTLLAKAEQLEREQRYEDAIALYTEFLSQEPHIPVVWFSKALALEAIAQYEEAARAYKRVMVLDSTSVATWLNHGICLAQCNQHHAIASYDHALAIIPNGYPSKSCQQVISDAQKCCEYCQTQQDLIGMPLVIDHIFPRAKGGKSDRANLAAACYRCNEFKGAKTYAIDSETDKKTDLFHPRQDTWSEHFTWTDAGICIEGLTPKGRGTVIVPKLNNDYVVESRRIWVAESWHPPAIDSF